MGGGCKRRRSIGVPGARPHAWKNLEFSPQEGVKRKNWSVSGWQDTLVAAVASVWAERMQNQELARPQTQGKVGRANPSASKGGESIELILGAERPNSLKNN